MIGLNNILTGINNFGGIPLPPGRISIKLIEKIK
jgi:hypothetical protein